MLAKGRLRIDRVVGNNVVLTKDPRTFKEYVLFGKGIGFASRGIDWIHIEDSRIEKRYRLDEDQPSQQFHELVENLEPEVVHISEEIIENIKAQMGVPVQPKVYFALPNHIQFALYRLQNQMEINNPFLYETRMSFPKEFEIASQAAGMISEHFKIPVPEDEVGFLALHVHSCVESVSVGQLVKLTGLLNRIVEHIESKREKRLPRSSGDCVRLIMHLRAAIERIVLGDRVSNPLAMEIKAHYPEMFAHATEIAGMIEEELHVDIPEDEIGYIAFHLHRLL